MKALLARVRLGDRPSRGKAAVTRLALAAIAAWAAGAATSEGWAATIAAPGGGGAVVTLPDATYSGSAVNSAYVQTNDAVSKPSSTQPVVGPGHISNSASVSSVGGAAAAQTSTGLIDVSLGPNPSVAVSITNSSLLSPPNYVLATAGGDDSATLNYSVEIIGPDGSIPVLINANGSYSANLAPGSTEASGFDFYGHNAIALFAVHASNFDVTADVIGFNSDGGPPSAPYTFSDDNTYMMQTNYIFTVQLTVEVSGTVSEGFGGGTETLSASVDPTFAIGSAVVDPNQYSIIFSPGIGNALPSTPEPSSWAMMLIGFASLGFAGYRRARSSRVAVNSLSASEI